MHLTARSIDFDHGPVPVLRGISVDVTEGDRIAVVGPNGSGKSTLLAILAGELRPTRGTVRRHPSDLSVGLLRQQMVAAPGQSVASYLAAHTGVAAAERELEAAAVAIGEGTAGAETRYETALHEWAERGAADHEARVAVALDRVGFPPERADDPVAVLSGGEGTRIDLALILLHRAPILALDEPTNALDREALDLLEGHVLSDPDRGLLLVSHDRRFLERVATEVIELDEHDHTASTYAGGWEAYEQARAEARRRAEEAYEGYVTERERLADRATRQRQWSARGVRHATTRARDNDKNIKRAKIARAERGAGRARRTEDQLARLERVDKPWDGWELRLRLADTPKSGDLAVALTGAVVTAGSFTLGPVDLAVHGRDRIAVVGPNGGGKTTLLGALTGERPLAAGDRRQGPSVVIGRLDQARLDFQSGDRLLDAFLARTAVTTNEARSSLAKLGLGSEHIARPAATLSPGERTRAVLAAFQVTGVNFMVLDEPTNHLDLPAIEQLEQVLATYAGTLLVVSHDQRFLDGLHTMRLLAVRDGRVSERGADGAS